MNPNTIKLFQSKDSDDWQTPKDILEELNKEFNFNLDPCPINPPQDGLKIDWIGNVFVNPPYSQITRWLEKAHKELQKGNVKTIVFLTFANTDTKWFHDFIYRKAEIRFIKGRLRFKGKNKKGELVSNCAMRPSMLAIFKNENKN